MGTSVYEVFEGICRKHPEKPALIYLGRVFTYGELEELVARFSSSLSRMGLKKGDRVMIYLPNTPQWVIAWLSILRIGAIAVPISPIYTPPDLKYMANDSGARIIVCLDANLGYVVQVLPETKIENVVVTNIIELLPWWKRFIGFAFNKVPRGKIPSEKGMHKFRDLLKPDKILDKKKTDQNDFIEILYTGGTTGEPKGVPYTNAVFLDSVYEQRSVTEKLIPKGTDVVIQGGPLFHIIGQAVGIGALLSGDTLILLPRVNLDGLMYHIQAYKAKTFFGVPTLYRMILEHDRVDYYDLSSLEYCFCGGDVLPQEVAERWKRKFGKHIYVGYGTTETCGRISLTPMGEDAPPGSAGKVTPLQEVLVVDPETLEPVPPGEAGECLVSSRHMVRGYWNKPEETARCFVEIGGKLWYRTRDIVRMDENGWLFFVDRTSDVIKHKGYRVAPSEVEAVLQEHPAVIAASVVGVPDEKVGERIKAFVVLKEDIKGISSYELIKWCRKRLASYKVPQYIEFRDVLPKSKVGKVLRKELRAGERRKREKSRVDI